MNQEFKNKLNAAFKELRSHGFMALQNYKCCNGCATSGIWNRYRDWTGKKPKPIAWVYYMKQDTEMSDDDGHLYIGFGIFEQLDDRQKQRLSGSLVKSVLEQQGLLIEWDGNPDNRVYIKSSKRDSKHRKIGSWSNRETTHAVS